MYKVLYYIMDLSLSTMTKLTQLLRFLVFKSLLVLVSVFVNVLSNIKDYNSL